MITTVTNTESHVLALEGLQEAWRRLKATPIPVAVWCVDRPDAIERIRNTFRAVEWPTMRSIVLECPVYEWYARYADADEWARRPDCFHTPGVYIQMNTGEYVRVGV